MNWIAINTVVYIISFSLVFHFSVISVQLWALVAEGFISRQGFLRNLLPPFYQNVGITCVILGFTYETKDLAAAGTLLVALGLLLSWGKEATIPPRLEMWLRGSAILALGSLLIVRAAM
jgi:hypothetical protein